MNRVFITTDIGCDADDQQSMIHALMLHQARRVEIVGIAIGYPCGDRFLVDRCLTAARRDGFAEAWKLKQKVYQGAKRKGLGVASSGAMQLIKLAMNGDERPLLVSVWGSATDLANAIREEPRIVPRIRAHVIASWNREQDPESHKFLKSVKGLRWIDNERDFRRMYQGWPIAKNREFVKMIGKKCGHLGALFADVSRNINTGKNSIKMGDTPSFQWAVEFQGSMKWTTKRQSILRLWKEVITEIYGEAK